MLPNAAQSRTPQDIICTLGQAAKNASRILAKTSSDQINNALDVIADKIIQSKDKILNANAIDIEHAKNKGLDDAMIDRLKLTKDRIKALSESVLTVKKLNDPTGKILWEENRPNGLKIKRVSCPIGVLGMIYESRPNVTVDAAILCLKSHNAVILRGGSESLNSALALHKIIQESLKECGLPENCVAMVPTPDREAVGAMLRAHEYIDVMIPRGGKTLIERVMNEARMPVFGHLEGLCHIYVHDKANIEMAKDITLNAKMRRTGICGAMETLLLDTGLTDSDAKSILQNLLQAGCEIVGDDRICALLPDNIKPATEEDWTTEYLSAKLSVRYVSGVDEAIEYINNYGSHHTDSIITEDNNAAQNFQYNVDSGIVMHNASTQFADGGEFGMGAEIGIATGKMHARGPVGLEQLCTYKYLVHGTGQTRPI